MARIRTTEPSGQDRLPLQEWGRPVAIHVTEPVSVVVALAGLGRFELAPESAAVEVVARLRENGYRWHPLLGWWKPTRGD